MNIKLHLFDLEFEKSNQKFEIIDSVKKFIDVNKVILENNFVKRLNCLMLKIF